MAINIIQGPYEGSPRSVYTPMIYRISSTNTSEPKFRFVARINHGVDVLAVLKITPNINGICVVDVSNILRDYHNNTRTFQNGSYEYSVIKVGEIGAPAIVNTGDIKLFNLDFGESYATSADTAPTITYLSYGNQILTTSMKLKQENVGNDQFSFELYTENYTPYKGVTSWSNYMNNTLAWNTERTPIIEGNITDISNFLTAGTSKMTEVNVYEDAPLPISFMCGVNFPFNNLVQIAEIQISTTSWTDSWVIGTDTVGSAPADVATEEEGMLYFGLGAGAIEQQSTSNFYNQAISDGYYDLRFYDGSSTYSYITRIRFHESDCATGKAFQVYWRNSVGGIDTLMMNGKVKWNTDVKKETYYKTPLNYNAATSSFSPWFAPVNTEGGETTFRTEVRRSLKLETQYIKDWEIQLVESLIMSDEVWLWESDAGVVMPVNCKTKSLPLKQGSTDGQFKYMLKFELSKKHIQ